MKRFYFLATLILGLLLSSCDKKDNALIDCDPPIITFEIIITDADGNLIINSEKRRREDSGIVNHRTTWPHCDPT